MKFKFLLSSLFVIFLFLVSSTSLFAAECGVAKIEPASGSQNWDITQCIGSSSQAEIESISSVKVTCRGGPLQVGSYFLDNLSCHEEGQFFGTPATTQSQTVNPEVHTDNSGNYFTCFTVQSLDRNMGEVDIEIKDSAGSNLCPTIRQNVVPGNYGWFEYFQNTLATRGVPLPTYNPESPENVPYCSDVTGKKGINTALGCISYDATGGGFIKDLLGIIIGLGGGVALLLILYGVFIVTTSAGIPEKLKEGKELITSAIAGLLFIIMAIFLMNLIGIKILALPGLQ